MSEDTMSSYYVYVFLLFASPGVLLAAASNAIDQVLIKSKDDVEFSVSGELLEKYSTSWKGFMERLNGMGYKTDNDGYSLPYRSEELALESIVGILRQAHDLFKKESRTYVQLAKRIPSYDEPKMTKVLQSAYTIFVLDERILKALALKCVISMPLRYKPMSNLCSTVNAFKFTNYFIGQYYLAHDHIPKEFKLISCLSSPFQGISLADLAAHNKLPSASLNRCLINLTDRYLADLDGADLPRGIKLLDLQHNQLTSVPDNLPQGVRDLYLGHNKLTSLPDDLPQKIGGLFLGHNQLTSIPDNLPPGIIKLFLQHNQLTSVPDNLPQGIEYLDLRGNPLTLEAKDNVRRMLPKATIYL